MSLDSVCVIDSRTDMSASTISIAAPRYKAVIRGWLPPKCVSRVSVLCVTPGLHRPKRARGGRPVGYQYQARCCRGASGSCRPWIRVTDVSPCPLHVPNKKPPHCFLVTRLYSGAVTAPRLAQVQVGATKLASKLARVGTSRRHVGGLSSDHLVSHVRVHVAAI